MSEHNPKTYNPPTDHLNPTRRCLTSHEMNAEVDRMKKEIAGGRVGYDPSPPSDVLQQRLREQIAIDEELRRAGLDKGKD